MVYLCCVYILNVQHHIDTVVLKAARKEILVFRERLKRRQACTFETKTLGLVSIQTVRHLCYITLSLKDCLRNSSFRKHLEMGICPEKYFFLTTKANAKG